LKKILDILLVKVDAFDSVGILNSIEGMNKSYVLITFNPKKGIYLGKNSLGLKKKTLSKLALTNINNKIYYFLSPIIFLYDYFRFFFQIYNFTRNFKIINNVYCDNTFLSFILAILKKTKKIKSFIYASHDWLPYYSQNKFWSSIGLKTFIYFDYFASINSNYIFNHTKMVSDLRNQYWNNKFVDKSIYFKPNFHFNINNSSSNKNKNQLCFLGLAKDYKGLEIILKAIRNTDYFLIIAGMNNDITSELESFCEREALSHKLKVTGYIDRDEMINIVKSSLIGFNITSKKSYTDIVLPSKFYDYILNNTPCIISNNQIISKEILNKTNIGLAIDSLNTDNVIEAILKIFNNYDYYQEKIRDYSNHYQPTNLKKFFI